MHTDASTRVRPWVGVPATLTRRDRRFLAVLLIALLVAGSLGYIATQQDPFGFASNPPPGDGKAPAATGRDPLLWPFSRDSIWNLPIGSDARYVWAGIRPATQMAYFTDADILILEPNAPLTTVYENYDDWGPGNRCSPQGPAMFTVPIPTDFVVPGSHQGSPDGDTPNSASAILGADGRTIYDSQPFARCSAGGPATSHYDYGSWYGREDLHGLGETGSHGGSALSALGGTVRLGELVPGGTIRHAMKLNIDNANFYAGYSGYRWPARKSDAGGAGYGGSIPEVRMGSLLAVKPDFAIASLETEPGRIVAQAFQNHGGYIVDTSGWSVYNFVTERSPDGAVQEEFERVWGYPLNTPVGANGWARDLIKIFTNLYVVDNWDYSTWQTVSASNGGLGVGGGAPRTSWAPDFGDPIPTPPPPSPPPPGQTATSLTLATSKNPSAINETVTVSGRLADASGNPVAGRNVFLEWSWDQITWSVEAQIGQFPATDANGAFSGTMAFRGFGDHIEYIRARFDGDATFAASLSPVVTQRVVVPPPAPPTGTTPPEVQSTLSGTAGSGNWYISPVTVMLSAADAGSGVAAVRIRLDFGPWLPYDRPHIMAGEGPHTVEYYATDHAGNTGPTQSRTFSIDTVAPVTSTSISGTPAPAGGYLSPVTITLISTDATSGVAATQYRIDGGAWRSYMGPLPLAGDGPHILESFATDHAGNREATRTESITLSGAAQSPPVAAMSLAGTSGTNGWHVSPVTVTLTATSDGGSATTIAYSLDNAPWITYGSPFQLAEGRHSLAYQASDASGYHGPAKSETILVDWTAPTLAAGTGNLVIRPDASLVWIGSDALSGIAGYEVGIDGGAFVAIGAEPQIAGPWTIGPHSVAVKAVDGAGNVATMTIPFQVDSAAAVDPMPPTPPAPGPSPTPAPTIPIPLSFPPGGSLFMALSLLLLTVTGLIVRRKRMDRAARSRGRRARKSGQRPSDWDWSERSQALEDDTDLPL